MNVFLLFLSFLFNVVAFLAIFLLFMRQNRLLEAEKSHKKTIEEMEAALSAYLLEMKEDNAAFLEQFKALQDEPAHETPASEEPVPHENESDQKAEPVPPAISRAVKSLAASRYRAVAEPVQETTEDQVVRRYTNGESIASIAQDLNKGQTEIELMLKFRKKA